MASVDTILEDTHEFIDWPDETASPEAWHEAADEWAETAHRHGPEFAVAEYRTEVRDYLGV